MHYLPRVSEGIYGGLKPANVAGFEFVININKGNVRASGFLEHIDSGMASMITTSDRNALGLQEHKSLVHALNTNPASLGRVKHIQHMQQIIQTNM